MFTWLFYSRLICWTELCCVYGCKRFFFIDTESTSNNDNSFFFSWRFALHPLTVKAGAPLTTFTAGVQMKRRPWAASPSSLKWCSIPERFSQSTPHLSRKQKTLRWTETWSDSQRAGGWEFTDNWQECKHTSVLVFLFVFLWITFQHLHQQESGHEVLQMDRRKKKMLMQKTANAPVQNALLKENWIKSVGKKIASNPNLKPVSFSSFFFLDPLQLQLCFRHLHS